MSDDLVERLLFHGRYATETQAECNTRKNAEREEAAAEIRRLREQVANTAEFICRKCGRRQDGPTDNEARF